MQSDRQRLQDWLLDLQRERVERLEELALLQATAKSAAAADPIVESLQTPPPYPVSAVDALRDELDSVQEKLLAAQASQRANQTELQNLNAQLKARAALARRTAEPSLSPLKEPDANRAHAEQEIASLLQQIAEAEIALVSLDLRRLGLEMAALRTRSTDLQSVLERVLPHQQLSAAELATQQTHARADGERLAEEISRLVKRQGEHRAERERLASHGGAPSRQALVMALMVKTDEATIKGLEHLRMLSNVSGDVWERRSILLNSTDQAQRRRAVEALTELKTKLADLRSLARNRQDLLSAEIRAQRARVENLAGGARERGPEEALLALLLQQSATDERTELAAARLQRQLSRWLDDQDGLGSRLGNGRLAWLLDSLAGVATSIWHQELLVAEDVTEVDGRQVTVKYGVTVGKSLGLVATFVLGYWLLAWLSRFVQRQLVARFKVSDAHASMVQRWSMIGLSIALLLLTLNLARIPLSMFAFAGGALAIGVGFGAQTVLKNFISGLILLFERKIRVGDIVELGSITGHVTSIDLRAATVLGFNGVEALIPNANFIEHQVINWTYSNRLVRREFRLGVAYGTNLVQLQSLLLAAAAAHSHVASDPAPEFFLEDFGQSALDVALVYWVELDDQMNSRRVGSELRQDIYARLAEAGISLPFPQHDVHLHTA